MEERAPNEHGEANEFELTEEELVQKRTMEAIVKLGQLRQASARNDNVAQFGTQGAGQAEPSGDDGGESRQVVAQLIELAECGPSKESEGE